MANEQAFGQYLELAVKRIGVLKSIDVQAIVQMIEAETESLTKLERKKLSTAQEEYIERRNNSDIVKNLGIPLLPINRETFVRNEFESVGLKLLSRETQISESVLRHYISGNLPRPIEHVEIILEGVQRLLGTLRMPAQWSLNMWDSSGLSEQTTRDHTVPLMVVKNKSTLLYVDLLANSIFNAPKFDPQYDCDIFVIMPFDDNFTSFYDDHLKEIAQKMGYIVKRGDDFFSKRAIMSDVWSAIVNAELIIADCSNRNPNVFYELGIAHTLDKPVIMIAQNVEDIPFDIRHLRVIIYEYTLQGMKRFEKDLTDGIEKIMSMKND